MNETAIMPCAATRARQIRIPSVNQRTLGWQGLDVTAISVHNKLQKGFQRHKAGDRRTAAQLYAEILTEAPENADAWHLSGLLALQDGRSDDAEQLIGHALTLQPDEVSFMANMAAVQLSLKKYGECEQWCRRALQIDPDRPDVMAHLGTALHRLGRLREAVELCRAVVRAKPADAAGLCNLGAALADAGELVEAVQVLQKAQVLNADRVEVHLNLGAVQRQLGCLEEAAVSLNTAVKLAPNHAEAAVNRGNLWLEQGMPQQALTEFHRALSVNPLSVTALNGLARGLQGLGHWNEAMEAFRLAVQNLGVKTRHADQNLTPIFGQEQRIVSNMLYCASLHPDFPRRDVYRLHSEWGRRLEASVTPIRHSDIDQPERRLRIGYVSPDYRQHATMRFFLPFFTQHDRAQFDLYCYSENVRTDHVTQQVRQLCDAWRTTKGLSDREMADQVLQDGIDILVDVAGHTAGNRLPVFAYKPAPVQISFLGYPNTTGLTRIDYLLTDAIREDSRSAQFFTEQLVALPHGACCFDAGAETPAVSDPPALANGFVTLGSTHRLEKLSPQCLRLWARVMSVIPGSRLLIIRDVLKSSDELKQNLLRQLEAAGADLKRVVLCGEVPENHLDVYARIDVMLDVFPWPSGTSAYEAMWMGVPVPAICDSSEYSRAAASFLHFCGCPQLIADSPEHYVQIVVEVVQDPMALRQLRHRLRTRMRHTVCHGARFARDLETTFRMMWRRRCGDTDAGMLPLIPPSVGADP